MRCGSCGYSLIGERQKGHVYYRCHTRNCATTAIREETAEGVIRTCIAPLRFDDRQWHTLQHEVAARQRDWRRESETRIKGLKLQRDDLAARNQRLTDAYLDGMLDKASYQERRMVLLSDIAAIEQGIGNLQNNGAMMHERVSEFLERLKTAQNLYESGSDEEKREFVKTTTSNRLLQGKNLSIALQNPFPAVREFTNSSYGAPYRDDPRTLRKRAKALVQFLCDYVSKEMENRDSKLSAQDRKTTE